MRGTATAQSDIQTTLLGRARPARQERSPTYLRGAPVLLLHGFLATSRSLRVLERRLRGDGFRVFSVGLGSRLNTRRVEEQSMIVRDEVERMYAREPDLPPLIVIGHSLGGLVASWWVKHLAGHRRVRTLVTLGTPHRGTRMAWAGILLGWLLPAIVQMLPGSAFLRRLDATRWPSRVALLSLYSRRDRVAPWPRALVGAGALQARNVEVDAAHGDYLLKKTIYLRIVNELRRMASREARRSTPAPSERIAA